MDSHADAEAAPEQEARLPTWLTPASGLLLLGGLLVEWSDGPLALRVPLFGGALILGGRGQASDVPCHQPCGHAGRSKPGARRTSRPLPFG